MQAFPVFVQTSRFVVVIALSERVVPASRTAQSGGAALATRRRERTPVTPAGKRPCWWWSLVWQVQSPVCRPCTNQSRSTLEEKSSTRFKRLTSRESWTPFGFSSPSWVAYRIQSSPLFEMPILQLEVHQSECVASRASRPIQRTTKRMLLFRTVIIKCRQ